MFRWKKPANELDIDIRFLLANERTLLAWVRTGLALIAGGLAVTVINNQSVYSTLASVGAIAFGGLFSLVGYIRYRVADAAIRAGKLPATGLSGILVVGAVVVFALLVVLLRAARLF